MNKRIAAGVAAGAIVLGAAGASLLIPGLVAAADPSSSPAATPSTPTTPSTPNSPATTAPSASTAPSDVNPGVPGDCPRMPGAPMGARMGGPLDAADITAAAKALGMSEADVTSALQSGKTLADLAKTQNVDPQTVIDAMVAAEKAEIQALVDAGTITQAQADWHIANLTQHETDVVNGTFGHRGPGMPGYGHRGGPMGQPPAAPTAPTTTSDSTSS